MKMDSLKPILLVALVTTLAAGGELTGPARILLLPYPGLNHTAGSSSMAQLGEELAGRGHEVHLLVPADYPEKQQLRTQGIMPVQYGGGGGGGARSRKDFRRDDYYRRDRKDNGNGGSDGFKTHVEFVRGKASDFRYACTEALGDQEMFQRLRRMNFDIAVVDAHPVSRCLLVLPYRLGIPYVSMVRYVEPWLQGNPDMPSFVPFAYGASDYSDNMSFWERFYNMWDMMSWSYDPAIETHREDYLARFTHDKTPRHVDDLAKESQLWFVESDVLLEYPRPNMPYVIDVGGMTSRQGKRLPAEVQTFMDDAKDGVVIVDLEEEDADHIDSTSGMMPYDGMERLSSAFKQMRYYYVWCYRGDRPPSRHPNSRVKMIPMMLRNDALGHNNARLFINNGQTNGQYEALYHGVPSLVLPSHGGQSQAARRVVHRGFGLSLDPFTFTPSEAVDAIESVIRNASFAHNVQKASSVFRSRHQNPRERAADWLEHALSHDMDYFRSHGQRLSQSAFFMLDVAAFVVFSHLGAAYITYSLLRCSCRRLFCRGWRHRDDDDDDDDRAVSGSPSGSRGYRGGQYRGAGTRVRKH